MQIARTYHQLDVYKLAFTLALDIHKLSGNFRNAETGIFSAKIQDASRLVSINIAEGWCRRKKEGALKAHLTNASNALSETQSWLNIGHSNRNIREEEFKALFTSSIELKEKLVELNEVVRQYGVAA